MMGTSADVLLYRCNHELIINVIAIEISGCKLINLLDLFCFSSIYVIFVVC